MLYLSFTIVLLACTAVSGFQRHHSLLLSAGRRIHKSNLFDSTTTVSTTASANVVEINVDAGAAKKPKKRSTADQVENLEEKRKQTEIWRFLKKDINMSDKLSKTIHELYPWLFDMDYTTKIKPVLELLRSYEFHNKVIRLIVKENPFIFQRSLVDIEKRINYLKEELQLTNLQCIHIFEYQPILLSLQEKKVVDVVTFFKEVVEFNQSQLQQFFRYQFRVWKTPVEDLRDYYGKLRALGYSPEAIQGRFLSNKHTQKKFFFQLPRVDSYDPRYLTEYLD